MDNFLLNNMDLINMDIEGLSNGSTSLHTFWSTQGSQLPNHDNLNMYVNEMFSEDKVKQWFRLLPVNNIYTWAQMQQVFLDEYFSIGKMSDARSAIKSFVQKPAEAFHDAFQRFNEMLRMCPYHEIPKWDLVKIFYVGLMPYEAKMVISSSGGAFLTRHEDFEWSFLGKLSKGSKT